jgi:predicted HTH transcriptional regulator
MNKGVLLQRLSDIEWEDFEVKKSFAELPKDIWETISAFSNTSGGWLILGVSQTGKTFENAGYGFDRMLVWKKETHKEVLFETSIDKTKVTFMLKDGKVDMTNITDSITENITENNKKAARKQQANNTVNDTVNDTANDTANDTDNDTDNIAERLTVNQKKIIEHIIANPYITSEELSKIVGIIPVNVRVNISKLKNKGIISREGANKRGKWLVKLSTNIN